MKHMKLGLKIGMGFGSLILIACLLGGMAVWNMSNVEHEADRLANEFPSENPYCAGAMIGCKIYTGG